MALSQDESLQCLMIIEELGTLFQFPPVWETIIV